ncbi:MAG: FAA hydrolase family protein [Bacteroidaceae bacterium]|nr:FAA hydrolase family protein [Bacteroidaceae bacterium]
MCSFAGMKIFVMHDLRPVVHNNGAFFSFNGMEAMPFGVLPDSALLRERRPMFVPPFAERCSVQTHLAVRICRLGRCVSPRFAHRYHEGATLAAVFRADNLLEVARSEGWPWDMAMGFDGSVAIGAPCGVEPTDVLHLRTLLGADTMAEVVVEREAWLTHIHAALARISAFHTLRQGDWLLCGALHRSQEVREGLRVEGWMDGERLMAFDVK